MAVATNLGDVKAQTKVIRKSIFSVAVGIPCVIVASFQWIGQTAGRSAMYSAVVLLVVFASCTVASEHNAKVSLNEILMKGTS